TDGIVVKVNGTTQPGGAYQFDAGQNAVVFGNYPAENATIQVNFKEKITFLTQFNIGAALPGSVGAKINGSAVSSGSFSYNAGTGLVTFNNAPPESASISISYLKPGDPILGYAYAMSPDQTSILVTDTMTGATVNASYSNGKVVIAAGEFAEGRKIDVRDPDATVPTFVETWY